MIAAGIFVLSGLAVEKVGAVAILSFLITAVVAGFTAAAYAEFSSIYRESGGGYIHTANTFDSNLTYIVGDPNWPEYNNQSRLEMWYDETDGRFRTSQPVTVSDDAQAIPPAEESAALDIGANNFVACTTTTGEQYLYEGRELFDQFRETTREIARLQFKLKEGRCTS